MRITCKIQCIQCRKTFDKIVSREPKPGELEKLCGACKDLMNNIPAPERKVRAHERSEEALKVAETNSIPVTIASDDGSSSMTVESPITWQTSNDGIYWVDVENKPKDSKFIRLYDKETKETIYE